MKWFWTICELHGMYEFFMICTKKSSPPTPQEGEIEGDLDLISIKIFNFRKLQLKGYEVVRL